MAVFVFELEALLRKRAHDERQQMGRVAEIERERLAIETEIRACQATITEEKRDLSGRLVTGGDRVGVDLRAVRMQANASLRLVDRAQRAVIRLKSVHDRLDAARLELIGLTTKRRAIELLREDRFEAWRREQGKREQAELDEIAVLRHGRAFGVGAEIGTGRDARGVEEAGGLR